MLTNKAFCVRHSLSSRLLGVRRGIRMVMLFFILMSELSLDQCRKLWISLLDAVPYKLLTMKNTELPPLPLFPLSRISDSKTKCKILKYQRVYLKRPTSSDLSSKWMWRQRIWTLRKRLICGIQYYLLVGRTSYLISYKN